MATNGGSVRDAAARRRRIAERGAERLALITGRLQSLSPPPPPPPSSPPLPPSEPSSTPPCPTSVSPNSDQPPLTDENTVSPSDRGTAGDDVVSDDVVSDVRSVIDKSEPITGASAQTSVTPNKIQSFPEALTEQAPPLSTSSKSKKPESHTQARLHKAFSPKQLRPAITASENTRIICSITVAVLVLLASAGYPILGSDVTKKIILLRPLLLLVVTNITIVAAHFFLQKVKPRSTGEAGFADHIGTVLEWGLLMKTGSSALFMDCSVYSVILICGMGFLQLFGL